MKFKIPFVNYELSVTKRGMTYLNPQGQVVGFTEWLGDAVFTPTTPILEEVYSTIANEFAKIDLILFKLKNTKTQALELVDYRAIC